jgi:uncharacterized membrane protein YeaQ/YmgE (transglycosylase-associated protein family)
MYIIGWIISGLIIGAIARLLMPGRQQMGILMTIVLGIVGALLGGGIAYMIWGEPGEPFSAHAWPGYLLSIVGAMLVLWGVGQSGRTRFR